MPNSRHSYHLITLSASTCTEQKYSVGFYRTWLYLSRRRQAQRDFPTAVGSEPPAPICPPQDGPARLLLSQTWNAWRGVEDATSNPDWRQRGYCLFWITRHRLDLNSTSLPTWSDGCRHLGVLTTIKSTVRLWVGFGKSLQSRCYNSHQGQWLLNLNSILPAQTHSVIARLSPTIGCGGCHPWRTGLGGFISRSLRWAQQQKQKVAKDLSLSNLNVSF